MVVINSTKKYKTKILGFDGLGDVALLKINDTNFVPNCTIPFARKPSSTSEKVMIIGDPFSFDHQSCAIGHIRDAQWTDVTLRTLLTCVTTDVATGPGNSGSPIINMDGECIGMHIGAFGDDSTQFGGGLVAEILENIIRDIRSNNDRSNSIPKYLFTGMIDKKKNEYNIYGNVAYEQVKYNNEFKFSKELVGYIITNDFNIFKKGDVLTHVNGEKVGIYDGCKSIGDVMWFSKKTDTIECNIVRKGIAMPCNADLELLKIKDDVATRSFQEVMRNGCDIYIE